VIINPLAPPIVTHPEPTGFVVEPHNGAVNVVFDNGGIMRLSPAVARKAARDLELAAKACVKVRK
jgi:hypothetical protein